jgi:putative phage-type endonuclease
MSGKRQTPIKLYHTLNMSPEQWRQHRNEGIGGSDVSAILGINKWRTPMQVYMEKTGQWEPDDLSGNDAVHFGNKLEGIVADEFTERTGLKVQKNNYMLQHPEHKFMLANIDREIIFPDGSRGVLECKTTSAWNKDEWTQNEVPQAYMVQVQHYLAVTGLEKAYIAVLIGGNRYDHWFIDRDEELIEIIIEAEKNFWENHIVAGEPPALNYGLDGSEILDKLYPAQESTDAEIDLTETERGGELLRNIYDTQQTIKALKADEEAYKNELKDLIKDKETAIHTLAKITWKAPKPREVIDEDKLIELFPDVYEQVKSTKASKRTFRINFKKGI